ncbi:MAG: hypothetical protein KIT27_08540 [Legionellales bacterium]|nr:hypothetical protein [Legionellales bacterium]
MIFKGKAEKLTWKDIRENVFHVNPEFAAIIDEVSPDDNHWLLKAEYPYGALVMQNSLLALPNEQGKIVPITDPSIAHDIQSGLSYNLNSNPVSFVLKNSFEIYLELDDRILPLSGLIMPGTAFGSWRVLNPEHSEQPKFIWDMSSGARSVFMLPKIAESLKHKKLIKTFGINSSLPKKLIQHWKVFRALANYQQENQWTAEILYFSEAWFKHLNDKTWNNFYQFFHRSGWANTEYWRNQPIRNLVLSLIIKDYELKPNAFIIDSAKYLLDIGIGASIGMGPAQTINSGPWDFIQDVYQHIYDIRNYPPIIIQPQVFNMKSDDPLPVYYSLQFPNATEFKPSTRTKVSIISDLHEIQSLMNRFKRDLLADRFNLQGTSLFNLFQRVKYDYFHNTTELHRDMKHTAEMASDPMLRTTIDGKTHQEFPASCLFGRGCIRISKQKTD